MLKILQARLQWYVNRELPDVQAGFRKGSGTRYQIANVRCIIEKAPYSAQEGKQPALVPSSGFILAPDIKRTQAAQRLK